MGETCPSCGATIIWRRHEETNKRAPIDAELSDRGNLQLVPPMHYRVLSKDEVKRLRELGVPFYINHFATCPAPPRGTS